MSLIGAPGLLLAVGCAFVSERALEERMDLDGDGLPRPEDCDDTDPAVTTLMVYVDSDGDGFGGATSLEVCAISEGYAALGGDCLDEQPAVHPDAEEICNGVDDDCDGLIDDGIEIPLWYLDGDGDGYGTPEDPFENCERPSERYSTDGGDCDDGDPDVRPGVEEVCDEIDNDCDGLLDDADPDAETSTWYWDGDGDGAGVPGVTVEACSAPGGYVSAERVDCDDDDPTTWIDAPELCDGVDNDCDEETGEEGTVTLDGVSAFDAIQGALDAATDGSTIDVCEGTFTENLEVWAAVSLQSRHGPDVTTLTAAKDGATVAILSTVDVSIAGFTITGGTGHPAAAVAMGGGVYAGPAAHLTISDCVITGNTADYGGGVAQWATGAGLTITDTTITDNTATDGAGLFIEDSAAELTGLTVEGNVASRDGGGIHVSRSSTTLASSTITANSASNDGGGLLDYGSDLILSELTVSGNQASGFGGGIQLSLSSVTLSGVTLSENTAYGGGGGWIGLHSEASLSDASFSRNVASTAGGLGISVDASVEMENTTLTSNTAVDGGGIYLRDSALALELTSFDGNTATSYGGGFVAENSTVVDVGGTHTGNDAESGGAVVLVSSIGTFDGLIADGNAAASYGGGLFLYDSTATISDGTLTTNTAENGGGLFVYESTATLDASVLNANVAEVGGGIYSTGGHLDMTTGVVEQNSGSYGGGLYVHDSTGEWAGGRIDGNVADSYGGGLYLSDATLSLSDCSVTANSAVAGGGLILFDSAVTLTSCAIESNAADSAGGGAYLATSELTSASSGWGAGTTDNAPDDVAIDGGSRYEDYGEVETFTCSESCP